MNWARLLGTVSECGAVGGSQGLGRAGSSLQGSVVLLALLALGGLAGVAQAQKSAEEELKTLQVPDGWDISLFAAEPLVVNPSAIDIDTHGRVWVAEIQWYRKAAKNPPADSIKVLEDTNGDGRADKVTVFAEGVFCPMSICVAGTKVYVATSPDLWVYEDANGDLKADGPPQKLLTGFGGQNHDHGAHSLVLGPDHKWWMSHGDTGFKVSGTDGSRIEYPKGAMLRGELDGSQLEQIAVNFRNPYEIAVSSFGESFCSDNDNDGNFSVRICWILEGGNYGWYGGPPFNRNELATRLPSGTPFAEHWHFRGHIPGNVPGTLVTGFGSPCGMCYYEGDAFGPEYRNAPLHADAGPREVRIYRHNPHGFGMQATSQNLVTTQGDNYFRPDDICTAPDGSLYVSDWYDGGVGGHAYNDPTRGRIFLLKPLGKKLARRETPGPYTTVEAALLGLQSPNLATQFLAREKLLAAAEGAVPELVKLLQSEEPNFRARALWLLDRIGGSARNEVVKQLDHADPVFRALAVRILRRHGEAHQAALLAKANDPSPLVRREVLLGIPRFVGDAALEALAQQTVRFDGTDRYELETLNIAAAGLKQPLFDRLDRSGQWTAAQLPLMQLLNPQAAAAYVTAQLNKSGLDSASAALLLDVAANTTAPEAGKSLLKLVANTAATADLRKLALAKVAANLSGSWKSLASDPDFGLTMKASLDDAALQSTALSIVAEQSLKPLTPDVIRLFVNTRTPPAVRQQAMTVAARLGGAEVSGELRKLLSDGDQAIRQAALGALVDAQDMSALRELLTGNTAPAALKTQAADRLMASTGGALVLLRLVNEGQLSPELQKATIAQAIKHPDSNVRVLFEKFVPEADRPQRLGSVIRADDIVALQADVARGEKIFFQSSAAQCKNCHAVNGVGTNIGPDLSQIGRKYERRTLLETILDPSKAIAPEYVPYLLETESGQVFAGFLVERSPKEVVLRDIKNQVIRVPAAEVAVLEEQKKSLMPELVLRDVTAQDAADLLAFLASLNSTTQHVARFRVLGPFATGQGKGLDFEYPVEKQGLATPDLTASFKGPRDSQLQWEEVSAVNQAGVLAIDQVKYCQQKQLPTENVVLYYLITALSTAEQDATLLIGSDDGCKAWINGQQVHRAATTRALAFGQDKVPVHLKAGRNVIVLKVENGSGPGGAALSIASPQPLDLQTN